MRKKALFICGSMNQTTQMHQIAREFPEVDAAFTPFYHDGVYETFRRLGLLEFTILGNKLRKRCLDYLHQHDLSIDIGGARHTYDLAVTCADLVVPGNIQTIPTVLVQEGMTDPETVFYHIVRRFPALPRWVASTATFGMSGMYDKFCVASEGYRELFARKGVPAAAMEVTGIPNFDNCAQYLQNDFPLRGYVLVCTSDARETFKYENRRRIIENAVTIAEWRTLVFKLHPNENVDRATREIRRLAPAALVFASGNTNHMVANCDILITQYSSTVFVGLALNKRVYSNFDTEELRRLCPVQNGRAAALIAGVCRTVMERGLTRRARSSRTTAADRSQAA